MNEIKLFNNEEFGNVRIIVEDNEILFCGNDVAKALGYSSPKDTIRNRCKGATKHRTLEKNKNRYGTITEQEVEMSFIPESDVYRLAFGSKLPNAEKFTDWVTKEVLPDIRKHGMYMSDEVVESVVSDPANFLKVLSAYVDSKNRVEELEAENAQQKELIENQNEQIEVLTPKGEYYDLVISSPGALNIGVIAQDYGFTARKLNAMLHEWGIQYKNGKTWVLYSKYNNKGYVKSETYADENISTIHTKWTQKGRYFIYENMKAHGVFPLAEREKNEKAEESDDNVIQLMLN